MATVEEDNEQVTLVTTDILTPYKKGEVFTTTRTMADKLMTIDNTENAFGPRNPEIKVRPFNEKKDKDLLLKTRVLNQKEHEKLDKELHPNK